MSFFWRHWVTALLAGPIALSGCDKPGERPESPASSASSAKAPNAEALLHLDAELRAAAQLIMRDVIDDFAPHIENEIKRRLDARMERLLSQYNS